MKVEVHVDRAAYRRHRRGMLLGLLAFALYLPAVIFILTLMAAVLGRETARQYTGAVVITGFVALMGTMLCGTRSSFFYRCPRCGRRLSKVVHAGSIRSQTSTITARIAVSYGISAGLGAAVTESVDRKATSSAARPRRRAIDAIGFHNVVCRCTEWGYIGSQENSRRSSPRLS